VSESYCELFLHALDFAWHARARDIRHCAGTWAHDVADGWSIQINPHDTEVDGIAARSVLALRLGMPVGVFGVDGGTMIGDSEARLIEVLKRATEELKRAEVKA